MRSLLYFSLAVAALAIPLSASAGKVGTMSTTVTAVSLAPNYSLSSSEPRYVAFRAVVKNVGGNVATGVLYTSDVTMQNANEAVTFHAVEGASCTNVGTAVDCSFGQMRPGDTKEFIVVYQSPVNLDATATNEVTYTALTYYAEGTGGPKSKPTNSTAGDDAVATLQAATPASANTVVPGGTTGFTLYTLPNDVFSTRVTLPAQANAVPASILEAPLASGQDCNNFQTCYQSTITIPGTFSPYLTIELHLDAANIKNGTQIGSVQIWYDYPNPANPAQTLAYQVGLCSTPTTPLGNGLPCIAQAVHYKNSSVPGWTPDLDDDFAWTLINTANGSYRLP
jgi:hypothetical protein